MESKVFYSITYFLYLFAFYVLWVIQLMVRGRQLLKRRRTGPANLQQIQQHTSYLKKMPQHLGMVFDSNDVFVHHISDLISWCIAANVHYITLYDLKGMLKTRQHTLEESVSLSNETLFGNKAASLLDLKWWARSGSYNEEVVHVSTEGTKQKSDSKDPTSVPLVNTHDFQIYITSYEDGKQQLLNTAKRICNAVEHKYLQYCDITDKLVDSNILVYPTVRAGSEQQRPPDPDFVLLFDESAMLCGFMPWHLRLTEILSMGGIRDITQASFIDSLYIFSQTEKRFGT